MAEDKSKHVVWALPLSLRALIITFLQSYDNNTLVVTLNEMATKLLIGSWKNCCSESKQVRKI